METIKKTWSGGLVGKLIIGCGGLMILSCICAVPLVILGGLGGDSDDTALSQISTEVPATSIPLPTFTPEPSPTAMPTVTRTPTLEPTSTPEPTATPIPSTNTPEPTLTDTPIPTLAPTDTPEPQLAEARLVIARVEKQMEFVDIQNIGGAPQDLTGWLLRSEKGSQDCPLGGTIQPGETLSVWAQTKDGDKGGFNCGFDGPIWNNDESDPAVLFDAADREVDRK